jgi:ornithine cyclodeaminase/alanine dehydrogenase-like protein (mu-crystallin family)
MALFFHAFEVDHLISFQEGVRIAEEALRDLGKGEGVSAPQKRLYIRHGESERKPHETITNIYAGGSSGYGAVGAHLSLRLAGGRNGAYANPPECVGIFLIYDVFTGSLLGMMAHPPRYVQKSGLNLGLRPAATSLAGLNLFARRDAKSVGIYGSGIQATSTFMGLTEMRQIEGAKVYSPTREHRERFAESMTELTGVPVRAVEAPREVVRDVGIVLCATGSHIPVLDGSWLEEGQYVISVVGSHFESMREAGVAQARREIDDETLRRSDLIVALLKEYAIEAKQGDLYWPVQNGVITWDQVVEISDVVAGKVQGRTNDKQIILYKNNGGPGIIEMALAKRCYELAREHGKGVEMEIQPRPYHRARVWGARSATPRSGMEKD